MWDGSSQHKRKKDGVFISLIVFGSIFAIVGTIMYLIAIGDRFVEHRRHERFSPVHKFFIVFGMMAVFLSVPMLYLGVRGYVQNSYYRMYENYLLAGEHVEVMAHKRSVLRVDLEAELDRYIQHEGRIISALEDRDSGGLLALLEQYPQLRASENVGALMQEYIKLTEDIANARSGVVLVSTDNKYAPLKYRPGVNESARTYNLWTRKIPTRWFIPGDLPPRLEFAEIAD